MLLLQLECKSDMSARIVTSQHWSTASTLHFLGLILLIDVAGNINTLLDMKFSKGRPSRMF